MSYEEDLEKRIEEIEKKYELEVTKSKDKIMADARKLWMTTYNLLVTEYCEDKSTHPAKLENYMMLAIGLTNNITDEFIKKFKDEK